MPKIKSTEGNVLAVLDGSRTIEIIDQGFGVCHECGKRPATGLFSGRKEKPVGKAKTPPFRGYLCEVCASAFAQGRFVGRSAMYRGVDWKKQRRKARQRDNYACRCCGKTRVEMKKFPNVHHIIPYRYSLSNDLLNLVCLCPKCHTIADAAWRALELNLNGDMRAVKLDSFFCEDGQVGYRSPMLG